MSYSDFELVTGVLNWSETKPDFDATFVENVAEQYEDEHKITPFQRAALWNIVRGWKINLDNFLD
jgi:hypothetical protein